MKIKKIIIEGEDGHMLQWTPFDLADYHQILGTFDAMIHEFGYGEESEDDMVDDE